MSPPRDIATEPLGGDVRGTVAGEVVSGTYPRRDKYISRTIVRRPTSNSTLWHGQKIGTAVETNNLTQCPVIGRI